MPTLERDQDYLVWLFIFSDYALMCIPQRERVSVAAFKPEVPKEEDEEALKPVGTGDAHGDIENINEVRYDNLMLLGWHEW
jgi:hypothetical protein